MILKRIFKRTGRGDGGIGLAKDRPLAGFNEHLTLRPCDLLSWYVIYISDCNNAKNVRGGV